MLLALALFVAAAAVVTTAMNASLASLERQRFGLQAANLAASVLAEIQLGIRPVAAAERQPLAPPYQEWTSEVLTPGGEAGSLDPDRPGLVEVVVRHENPTVVQRLAQVIGRPTNVASTNLVGTLP